MPSPKRRSTPSGVIGAGADPGSCRYTRWSAKLANHTTPAATQKHSPPYSCTRVRTLNGASVTSRAAPSAVRRTITLRAPSAGRISTQYTSSPSSWIAPSRTASCTIRSAVMGDFQEPYGAMVGMTMMVPDFPATS